MVAHTLLVAMGNAMNGHVTASLKYDEAGFFAEHPTDAERIARLADDFGKVWAAKAAEARAAVETPDHLGDLGIVNVRTYGAVGDGVTDDTAAIQAAIDAAATALPNVTGTGTGGGVVFLPKSTFGISRTLVVPQSVQIRGVGMRASRLVALPSFSHDSPMVRLGIGEKPDHGMGLVDLSLNCEGIAGVGGVYTESWQEPSYLDRVLIRGYRGKGFWAKETKNTMPSHGHITNCEFYSSSLGSDSGILIEGAANTHIITRCTITSQLSGNQQSADVAIEASDANLVLTGVHIERHVTGVQVTAGSGSRGSVLINSITGHPSVDVLVNITDTSPHVIFNARSFGAGVVVQDSVQEFSSAASVPFYVNRPLVAPED